MLIDTHAHVNFKAFEGEEENIIRRAHEAGVLVVNVGTQLDTSKQALEFAKKYQNLEFPTYAVVGLHPVHTYSQHVDEEESHFKTREEKFDYEAYKKLAQNPLVVGIGECGLDYYRLKTEDSGIKPEEMKELQKQAFIQQIELAKELNKALVIHCRPGAGSQDAYEDILKILDQHISLSATKPFRFEIHSFTGSPEIAEEFLKRGAFVGLNGIITFGDRKEKNSPTSAEALAKAGDKTGNMEKVIQAVPLEKIVLETDSPYLTPVPHRGKKNEPSFVRFVAEYLARAKGVSVEEVERKTTENARALFLLP